MYDHILGRRRIQRHLESRDGASAARSQAFFDRIRSQSRHIVMLFLSGDRARAAWCQAFFVGDEARAARSQAFLAGDRARLLYVCHET